MKYLPLETCKHLVSLGCTSESGFFYYPYGKPEVNEKDPEWKQFAPKYLPEMREKMTPAFSLEDLLRKENAVMIWPKYDGDEAYGRTERILRIFQENPDTWPEEIAKLIQPKAEEGGEDKKR